MIGVRALLRCSCCRRLCAAKDVRAVESGLSRRGSMRRKASIVRFLERDQQGGDPANEAFISVSELGEHEQSQSWGPTRTHGTGRVSAVLLLLNTINHLR